MTLPPVLSRRFARIFLVVAVVATVLPLSATPAFAAGNQAVSLLGTSPANQHVDLGAGSTGLGSNQFTLELWFKRTGAGVATGTSSAAPGLTSVIPLITKGRTQSGEGDGSTADVAFFLGIDSATGRLAADFEDGEFAPVPGTNHGLIGVLPSATTAIPMNIWQHAAVTYDGVSMRLYLNGQLDIVGPAINQSPRSPSAHRVGIGTSFNAVAPISAAGFFAGQIDEARIWSVARTQTQIQSTINSELTSGTGLTGRWGMNEGSGTTVAGSVGGINGTLVNGGTWAAGAPMLDPITAPTPGGNNGLRLDGVDDAVNLGAGGGSPPPLGVTNFTLELWFKQMGGGQIASTGTGGATTAVPLITKGRSEADGDNRDTNYFLGINAATGMLAADFEANPGGANSPVFGSTAITQNVWHHAAATFNGSQFCLYLDGVLTGTCTATTNVPRLDSLHIPAIGAAYDSAGQAVGRFAGMVDEARIWSVARTQAQIQAAMNTPITTPTAGLLGRWAMDEGTGTTTANTAGSAGVNGTLQNGTTWTSGAPIDSPSGGNFGVQLDGTDDAIHLGTGGVAAPLGATQFTLELWFKRTAAGAIASTGSGGATSIVPLITKGRSQGDGTNVDTNYFLGINTSTTGGPGPTIANTLAADFEDLDAADNNNPVFGTTVITMNVWHHAAATFNGSLFCLYLDGVLDGPCFATTNIPRSDSIQMPAIGTAWDAQTPIPMAAGRFAGQVDEARIWNVARTQAQIQSTMNVEIVSPVAGLLGRWGMNEGMNATAFNTAGSAGVNGTLVGGATWVAGSSGVNPAPNQAPVVDSVVIDQASAQTNDTLSATVTAHDPDGPAPTIAYQWTRNGTDISGATAATLNLATAGNGDKGDLIRVRATASDGQATSAPMTSSPLTVANTAPSATVSLDSDSPGTNDILTATATISDADVADTVTLTYLWTVNGTTRQTTTGTSSLTDTFDLSLPNQGNAGDTIVVTVTPNDGTANGTGVTDSATVATPANQAPVVDSVVIDQASAQTNDTLSATVTAHDPDGPAPTIAYQWTRNGTDISGATAATLNLATAGNGDKGDLIRVRATASDGQATSAPMTSSPLTVANTAPSATVSLDSDSPGTNDILTATATISDADVADTVTLTYLWTVNGTTRQTTTGTSSLTDTFDLSLPNQGNAGDTIVVTVTPNDGTANGTGVTDSATVATPANQAPVVDSVVIDQASAQTNDTLSATVTAHDPDGPAPTIAYQWTRNGTDISGATAATLNLATAGNGDKGDLIRVRATASDGQATSAPMTSSPLTVANTAPSATVSLDSDSPGTNDILTATATISDADVADTVTLTYLWTVNGTTRQTTTGTSSLTDTFDLSLPNQGNAGDTIVVTVTPNDGTANGTGVTDSATVATPANQAPVVDSVVIDQASAQTNDTLSATVTAHDPDGPAPTIAYQWTRNGTDISGATAATLNLATAGNGDKGDLIRVRATASDGQATSAPMTSSPLTVANTAPSATVSLDSDSPGTNDILTATATISDADVADTVTLTYLWTVNGTTRQTTTGTSSLTDTFDLSLPNQGNAGDTIVVTVTPNDGTANGTGVTDSATVATPANQAPVVDSVVIDQASAQTNDTLSATVTAHDPDGPAPTIAYQWTRNGTDISGATAATLNLATAGNGDKGDLIRVRATASDGQATSAPMTSSPLTVANTAPSATVSLDSDSPGTNDILTATATISDADVADTVTLTYLWTVNGTTRQTTTGTSSLTDTFDLSLPNQGNAGDTIVVTVTPNDGTANGTGVTDSATVASGVTPPIFIDDFANLNAWTVTRLTLDGATGSPSAPSGRVQVTGQTGWAFHNLGSTHMQVCASVEVNVASASAAIDLFRLRTAANGAIIKIVRLATGNLQIRSDFSSTTINSGAALGAGWHEVELCGTVGPTTTWDLYRDGTQVVTDWQADTGSTGVGRIQLGDAAAKTFTANFDHVVVDLVPGEGQAPDVTPPTTPGKPAGTSPSNGTIQISWAASTDDTPPITYRVYRDGNPTPIGSTTSTTFADPGLAPSSVHTYAVDAFDALTNTSAMSLTSDPITVAGSTAPLFADDFASLAAWSGVTRIVLDNASGSPSAPSARAQTTNQSASAFHSLVSPVMTACTSMNVNRATAGAVDLFRLRTAANGSIIKVVALATGNLQLRSDFASTTFNSGVALGSGWHNVELCGTVGAATSWDLYRDGVQIVNDWVANTGTTAIGRVQIGDVVAKTFTMNFDHVVMDLAPGENQGPDETGPTTPGQPAGSSATSGTIQLTWAASTDDTPPITYRVYRDGNPTSIGSTTATTFNDTGLTPASVHTYTVDAIDGVDNPSAMSPASAPITVSSGTPPIFADDFTAGNFLNWTAFTRMTIDNAIGSAAAPSARAQVTAQSAFAYRDLAATTSTACMSVNVNVASSTGFDVFRLRTAANGAIIKVVVTPAGTLQIRSDFGSTTINSGIALGTGWHNVELCGTVGSATTWNLYRDGTPIVNNWTANTGTTPIGRVQIGDTAAKTFTANFDHVVLDQVVGD